MAREKLTVASETDGDAWLKLGPSSYKADGEAELFIAWREVGEDGALRVVERVRPWQPGAKLDETGPAPDTLQLAAVFNVDVSEPEVDAQGIQIWPDLLEALVAQFKTGQTATLNLPWKRGLRVKPLNWQRRATSDDNRGGETLTVTFKTDSEDALDREAFELVSVKATLRRAAEEAVFTMEQEGMSASLPEGSLRVGVLVSDLITMADELVTMLNSPSTFATNILTQANRLRGAAKSIMNEYSSDEPGRGQMRGPEGSSARSKLLALLELAAAAEAEAQASLPKTRTYTPQRRTSIWLIATELGQNARQLMGINSAIADFNNIEKGEPVKVFA